MSTRSHTPLSDLTIVVIHTVGALFLAIGYLAVLASLVLLGLYATTNVILGVTRPGEGSPLEIAAVLIAFLLLLGGIIKAGRKSFAAPTPDQLSGVRKDRKAAHEYAEQAEAAFLAGDATRAQTLAALATMRQMRALDVLIEERYGFAFARHAAYDETKAALARLRKGYHPDASTGADAAQAS